MRRHRPWWTALVVAVATLTLVAPAHGNDERFRDVAGDFGLEAEGARVAWGDLDGDGWLDAIVDRHRVFVQRPTATPRFVEQLDHGLDVDPDVEGERRADFVVLGDVDADGDLDVFSGIRLELEFWQRDPENEGAPLVDDAGERVPQKPDAGFRSRIYLNDGSGRFTAAAGSDLANPATTSTCATFLDYDLDGNLDLFVGNWYVSYGWSVEAYDDRLYRGLGDGRFEDVTAKAGLVLEREAGTRGSARPTYGVAAADWDADGDQDLFVCAYGRQWNLHWRNRGDGTFEEIGESTGFDGDANRSGHYPPIVRRGTESPFRSNGNTFDVALADFDDDGDLDAFLADITHWWAGSSSDRSQVLVNQGSDEAFRFERPGTLGIEREHVDRWNQGDIAAAWADLDGDGWLDLLLGSSDYPDDQRLRCFWNDSGRGFEDRTQALGLDWIGAAQFSVGDVDRDGDPDVLTGRSLFRLDAETRKALGPEVGLLLNPTDDARWLTIELAGNGPGGANRQGIGARVEIDLTDRTLHRIVQGGAGHGGRQDPAELLVGLGPLPESPPADAAESGQPTVLITVFWPNAARTRTEHLVEVVGPHTAVRLGEDGSAAPRRN